MSHTMMIRHVEMVSNQADFYEEEIQKVINDTIGGDYVESRLRFRFPCKK